jgi:hypothetical protein
MLRAARLGISKLTVSVHLVDILFLLVTQNIRQGLRVVWRATAKAATRCVCGLPIAARLGLEPR